MKFTLHIKPKTNSYQWEIDSELFTAKGEVYYAESEDDAKKGIVKRLEKQLIGIGSHMRSLNKQKDDIENQLKIESLKVEELVQIIDAISSTITR
jgi:hypothetical protein